MCQHAAQPAGAASHCPQVHGHPASRRCQPPGRFLLTSPLQLFLITRWALPWQEEDQLYPSSGAGFHGDPLLCSSPAPCPLPGPRTCHAHVRPRAFSRACCTFCPDSSSRDIPAAGSAPPSGPRLVVILSMRASLIVPFYLATTGPVDCLPSHSGRTWLCSPLSEGGVDERGRRLPAPHCAGGSEARRGLGLPAARGP